MKNNFKENEELDIIVLMEKIKLMFLSLFLQIFRRTKSMFLKWKQLLVVVLVGLAVGYLLTDKEKQKSKQANILVKVNFDAGNYVYDAIALINSKISTGDLSFFNQEMMLDETEVIDEISITPIVDIKDIMEKDINANEVRALFENLEYEDSFSVTQGFRSDYDYHLITLNVSDNSSISTVGKVIDYFNRNPLFAELKDRNLQRISSVIYDNEQTINQIDKIIDHYSSQKEINSAQFYIDNKDIRPNDLIKTKVNLQKENEELKNESLISKQTVMIINDTNVLIEDKSLSSNLMIYYPIMFLGLYLFISLSIGLYSYLDKLDRAG
ncbi:MAG: hypothetical protein CMC51_02985 [Flavobacteriaceae bacterium]|jgi:hypothetical protein|nr:hypothetical protein [Flavobacteriaceae bacterium]|tara:strand:+ start:10726 stop:11700 length:975 start_codon:yes stop_codon:yes gene_type:complete